MTKLRIETVLSALAMFITACGGNDGDHPSTEGTGGGGASSDGGSSMTGGESSAGSATGGTGGSTSETGGSASATGGATAKGGSASTTGGATAKGGSTSTTGGATAKGGSTSTTGGSTGTGGTATPPEPVQGWPTENPYSWDGSWNPKDSDFPIEGLFDDKYDGTFKARDNRMPALPPGDWDYKASDNDLAYLDAYVKRLGTLDPQADSKGRQFGWKLTLATPGNVDADALEAHFQGSSGTDIVNLGPNSKLASFAEGNLADGPDILVFNTSASLDFRTGSSLTGGLRDNDLVVAGCTPHTDATFGIQTTTIHTGPGADWVFIRDLDRSAIDLGNGASGRTDTVDPADGNDLVVIRGNSHDFRMYGGAGSDTFIWYVDDNIQDTAWLGPNFFGTGGAGQALWGDPGIDRIVLAVPADTPIRATGGNGAIAVKSTAGTVSLDGPTQGDVFAKYCIECGASSSGRKTLIISYTSADGKVITGNTYFTDFEELQVGVGDGARLYRLDDVAGTATLDNTLKAVNPPSWPTKYCAP